MFLPLGEHTSLAGYSHTMLIGCFASIFSPVDFDSHFDRMKICTPTSIASLDTLLTSPRFNFSLETPSQLYHQVLQLLDSEVSKLRVHLQLWESRFEQVIPRDALRYIPADIGIECMVLSV